jgi:hypothetical protein
MRPHSYQSIFFSRKNFANRSFAEHAMVNSPNSFAGRGIAVGHIW